MTSSTEASFPLRRLPYVVLQEVLRNMDLIEQIELSLCSKKCIQLIKIARRNKKLYVRLDGWNDRCLLIYVENDYDRGCSLAVYDNSELKNGINFHAGMINSHKIKFHRAEYNTLKTYWEDRTTGKVEIFKYITDLFKYPRIIGALIFEQIPIRPLYDWIAQKYDGIIDEWEIWGRNRSQEDVKYLADICRKGRKVEYTAYNEEHRFDLNFDTDHLHLSCVNWLNLDDMMKLSYQSVILRFDHSSLTSKDVNGFLKNWIQTTHPFKMRFLFLSGGDGYKRMRGYQDYNFNIDVILSGIEHKPIGALSNYLLQLVDYFHRFPTKTGLTIQRNNGELASIFFNLEDLSYFQMILQ